MDQLGVERGPQNRILLAVGSVRGEMWIVSGPKLPRMRNANHSLHIAQTGLQHFITPYNSRSTETEQRMVGKNGLDAHCPGVQNGFHTQRTEGHVRVYNLNGFANIDLA